MEATQSSSSENHVSPCERESGIGNPARPQWECNLCREKFKYKMFLTVHLYKVHSFTAHDIKMFHAGHSTATDINTDGKEPPGPKANIDCANFVCFHCKRKMRDLNTFFQHLLTHQFQSKRRCPVYRCSHCHSITSNMDFFKRHVCKGRPFDSEDLVNVEKGSIRVLKNNIRMKFRHGINKMSSSSRTEKKTEAPQEVRKKADHVSTPKQVKYRHFRCTKCNFTTCHRRQVLRHVKKCHLVHMEVSNEKVSDNTLEITSQTSTASQNPSSNESIRDLTNCGDIMCDQNETNPVSKLKRGGSCLQTSLKDIQIQTNPVIKLKRGGSGLQTSLKDIRLQELQERQDKPARHIYYCMLCNYQSKYRSCVTKHRLLKHDEGQKDHAFERDRGQKYEGKVHLVKKLGDKSYPREKTVHFVGCKSIYSCPYCKYQTTFQGNMKRHVLRELGWKIHRCNFCDFASWDRSVFSGHFRARHPALFLLPKDMFRTVALSTEQEKKLRDILAPDSTCTCYHTINTNKSSASTESDEQEKSRVQGIPDTTPTVFMPSAPNIDVDPLSPFDSGTNKREQRLSKYGVIHKSQVIRQKLLKRHTLDGHSKLTYSCVRCGYQTKSPANMRYHIRRKLNYMPYQCPLPHCQFRASQSSLLPLHMKRSHEWKDKDKCTYVYIPEFWGIKSVYALLRQSSTDFPRAPLRNSVGKRKQNNQANQRASSSRKSCMKWKRTILTDCQTVVSRKPCAGRKRSVMIEECKTLKDQSPDPLVDHFKEGDLVWAKLGTHPWWPSMVCKHPKAKAYRKDSKIHVQFFDYPPSRAWVKVKYVTDYTGSQSQEFQKGGKFYRNDSFLKLIARQADHVMDMSFHDRLKLVVP